MRDRSNSFSMLCQRAPNFPWKWAPNIPYVQAACSSFFCGVVNLGGLPRRLGVTCLWLISCDLASGSRLACCRIR